MKTRLLCIASVILSVGLLLLPVLQGTKEISNGWGAFAGRLHILLIHFPIVLILILLLTWFATRVLKKSGFAIVLPWLWVLTIVACLTSVTAGYLLYRSGEYEGEFVQNHFWGGVVTAIAILWGGFAYFQTTRGRSPYWAQVHSLLLLFAAVSVIYTGHMGGSLTHGSDFLTEMIPIKAGSVSTGEIVEKDPESLRVFQDLLVPVF